mmetsp:Transcript_83347/g.131915  ORF Transcript_83347/g.131915 Transcript_83347/m.131915 type:complete len:245 (-) Transcript_83347:145-879(-)
MHGQLAVESIHQSHGVDTFQPFEVNHPAHHQHAVLLGGIRAMSPDHCMGDGIGTVEMVQGREAPPWALHTIDRHAVRSVLLVQELRCQTLAFAIGHEERIAAVTCVVWVEPHDDTVLEAALPNVHEIGVGIPQRFGCLLGRLYVLHLELLGVEVEFTHGYSSQAIVHHVLKHLGALRHRIPPGGLRQLHRLRDDGVARSGIPWPSGRISHSDQGQGHHCHRQLSPKPSTLGSGHRIHLWQRHLH